MAVRIWPASSYTRATLESTRPLQHKYFLLDNPRRLVVDIQGASLDSVVQSLPQKLSRSDPYVAGIRVGQFNPDTIRVVMDLKTAVNPQVFALTPVANFKHRLVIDLYPTQAVALAQEANDPLMALLQDYTNGRIRQDGTATEQAQTTSVPPVTYFCAVMSLIHIRVAKRSILKSHSDSKWKLMMLRLVRVVTRRMWQRR